MDDIEVTPGGGKHTRLDERADLLPMDALLQVARIIKVGAEKYGVDNWRKIDRSARINHALVHIFKGEYQNATCRLLFALETQ